jgi:alpha-amylase
MKKVKLVAVLWLSCTLMSQGQEFMMQGFYWNYPNLFGIRRYAQDLIAKVPDMHEAGFTYLWLPPLSRSSVGLKSIGYDVKDYYDLGEYGLGATRFGSRNDVRNMISTLHANKMHAVADIIFNHRAGGAPERNDAVKGWIENYTAAKVNAGDNPFPSDRFRCYIPLGDTSHNVSGTYYVQIRSVSQHSNFYGKPYTFSAWTNKVPLAFTFDTINDGWEYEPNDGGSCGSGSGDTSNFYILGSRKYAHVDNGGCGVDEFRIKLDTSLFYQTGDTLYITVANTGAQNLGDFSDQYVHGIWYDSLSRDLYSEVVYQTFTDFTHMPSGKGSMDKSNFRPNGAPTQLSGDWDEMLFFYDIDQGVSSTQTVLSDFAEWMFDSVGIEGIRLDAVKNYPYSFVSTVLNNLSQHQHNPGMIVGEFYDYNPASLNGWVNNVKNGLTQSANDSLNIRVFDFALRGALKSSCDQFGYDVRNLFSSGMVASGNGTAKNAVTFINNHDFRDAGQPVTYNPELAYAYILTNNQIGVPCVYYLDYFTGNFMRGRIKGLMHANQKYINGSTWIDYLSKFGSPYSQYFTGNNYASTTSIYQMHNPTNNEEIIVAINFAGDTLNMYQQVNTNLAPGDTFTDIFGVAKPPLLTAITANRELHVMLPPRSFTVYVKGNHSDSLISLGDTLPPAQPNGISQAESSSAMARIYPNPFSTKIMIQLSTESDEPVGVEMTDIAGRKIYADSAITVNRKLFIDPAVSIEGIYFLKVSTRERSETYKLVKQ